MRRSLALLVIAGLLPLIALSAVFAAEMLHVERYATEQQAHAHAQFAATLIAGRLRDDLAKVKMLADALSADELLDRGRVDDLASRILSDDPSWRSISVVDPAGVHRLDTPQRAASDPQTVVDQNSFRLALLTRRPVLGQVLMRPSANLSFAVRAPVIREGRIAYVLSAIVPSASVRDLLLFQPLPAGWRASIVDGAGMVIASSNPASARLGRRATEETLAARSQGVQGLYYYRRHDGVRVAAVFVPIPNTDWTVHVAAPAIYYTAPTRQAFLVIAISAVACIGLVIVLARLLSAEQRQTRLREASALQSQRMEALGRLTGGVAHDFNNLLTPIVGGLDLLRRQTEDNPKAQRYIDAAMTSAERARVLVGRLLSFSRRQTLAPRDIDLADLLAGLSDLLIRSLAPMVDLQLAIPHGLPTVHADAAQLELAIVNLAINGRDAMADGGTVRISVRPATPTECVDLVQGDYVAILVSDSGTGMDQATMHQAIDPFFTTKAADKGTGLGLSMVHGFAAQSGGVLHLASQVGSGTTVTIVLPQGDAAKPPAQRKPKHLSSVSRVILLVDDDDAVRGATAAMLLEAGHAVWQADSVDAAADLLSQHSDIDTVVTDYLMPGKTGGDLIRIVRDSRPDIPVLLITGYIGAGDDLPRDVPIIRKPFQSDELLESLETALPPTA